MHDINFSDSRKQPEFLLKNEIDNKLAQYRKANLEALQHQISPHFLTNTLARINREVEKAEGYRSSDGSMLVKLSQLTAYCMKQENTFVKISDELECADLYVLLMQGKYGDFKFKKSVEAGAEQYKIIKMTLQPLIENAVYHGISGKDDRVIELDIHTDENSVFVTIKDNGCGIQPPKLDVLNRSLNARTNVFGRIGIFNVAKRLQLGMCCNENFISFESIEGEFTGITIKLPKEISC